VHQGQSQHPAAEAEPVVAVVHERRQRRHLHRIRVVGRVLEQAVVRVEQFAGEQEEELARGSAVVQALLRVPQHGEAAALQVLLVGRHDAAEGVLQQVAAADVQSERKRLPD